MHLTLVEDHIVVDGAVTRISSIGLDLTFDGLVKSKLMAGGCECNIDSRFRRRD